jgi:hypothetical protein
MNVTVIWSFGALVPAARGIFILLVEEEKRR